MDDSRIVLLVHWIVSSALYDSKEVLNQKPWPSKISTGTVTKCFVISKGNILFQSYIIYTKITGANFKALFTELIITVDTL